ncbi:MAG: MFS transporter [Gammaproteobacteria bacterium]|nr:MFS transporter [Gammaproteobacteria bacterium]
MDRQAERRALERNFGTTLAVAFFQVFLVIMPVAVPFFQSRGLDMQQIFALQAIFAAVILITEVPSGYAADLLGRRPTLLVGAVVAGVGHTILVFADGFAGLALFEVALGISASLISGSDIAIIYDSEAALGRGEEEQRKVVGRLYSVRTFSEAIAAVVCSLLLLVSLEMVVYVQAVIGWIPLLLAIRLVEPPVVRLEQSGHLRNMAQICRHMVQHSLVLRLTFLALCVWSLTTFYAVWLIQELWQQQGIALALFGYLWAGLTVIAAVAGRWAHVVEARLGTSGVLVLIGVLPALGYLGLDLLGPVGAFLASGSFFLARGVGMVVLRDALNRRVPGHYRATANSLASFGFRAAFIVTGPVVGQVLDLWGMSTTLWLLAGASLVILAGLLLPLLAAARAQRVMPEAV